MPDSGPLAGCVCVLAGGSGGIGAVLARQLHAEGAALVIGYRRTRERAEALVAELTAAGRAPAVAVGGDLAHEDTRDRLRQAARELGVPYGLVVLAGDPARPASGVATQAEMEASLIDNYVGPVSLARAFATDLASAGGGSIVL